MFLSSEWKTYPQWTFHKDTQFIVKYIHKSFTCLIKLGQLIDYKMLTYTTSFEVCGIRLESDRQ